MGSRDVRALIAMWVVATCTTCAGPPRRDDVAVTDARVPPLRVSGKRLKAIRVVTDDGVEVAGAWFDSELGERCQFLKAEDGKRRCLPEGTPRATLFADAACERPVVVPEPGCGTRFASVRKPTARGATIVRLGPPEAAGALFSRRGESCVPATAKPERVQPGLEELPPSGFVGELGGRPARTDRRIAPYYLHMEDGATEWLGAYDNQIGAPCKPLLAEDGRERCLPPGPSPLRTAYADAACRDPVVPVDTGSPMFDGPFWSVRDRFVAGGVAPREGSPYRVSRWVSYEGPVFELKDGACELRARDGSALLRPDSAGERIPPETFVVVERKIVVGARLRRTFAVFDGDTPAAERLPKSFDDMQLGGRCTFYRMADGPWRCLPGGGYSPFFEDPQCTRRLVLPATIADHPRPGRPSRGWGMTIDGASACDGRYAMYHLGRSAMTAYQRHADGTCEEVGTKPSTYLRGEPLDLQGFVSASERRD